MLNSIFRFTIIIFLVFGISKTIHSQLSMFNKIDTIKGYNTKMIPLSKGGLLFSGPQSNSENFKFRMMKINECGEVDWIKEFKSDSVCGYYKPDAVSISGEIYVLLKSEKTTNNPDILTLVKLNEGGTIFWAKNIRLPLKSIRSQYSNLLQKNNNLYIVTNDKNNNTLITALDRNGVIQSSKLIKGISHGSSTLDQQGNIWLFSRDSLYAKIKVNGEEIDTVLWTKKISKRFFALNEDPVNLTTNTGYRIITGIIDTLTKASNTGKDTALYRLISFAEDGSVKVETEAFYAPKNVIYPMSLKYNQTKDPANIYCMVKNRVGFYSIDLVKNMDGKYYKFQKDSFDVVDANLEICDDATLIMSGFCYKKTKTGEFNLFNPYIFVSKTQKSENKFKVLSEEPICLSDSSDTRYQNLIATSVSDLVKKDSLITPSAFNITFTQISNDRFHEDHCGKVLMDKTEDTKIFCPFTEANFSVTWYKGADYKWSTGSKDDGKTEITVAEPGTYTATVTLCDTVKVSKFVYELNKTVSSCFEVLAPNAFLPGLTQDTLNTEFRSYSRFKEIKEKIIPFSKYNMQVFDRWGEKVFNTNDVSVGWDGSFKNKPMPPGVYLYNMNWEYTIFGYTYKGDNKGQVTLLR